MTVMTMLMMIFHTMIVDVSSVPSILQMSFFKYKLYIDGSVTVYARNLQELETNIFKMSRKYFCSIKEEVLLVREN